MNVTLDGGTPQQRAWVSEALAASSYPYANLAADVTVTWAPSTPCGLNHTYMCTTDHGDGTFTITIEDWADDPTAANNLGLPNPPADIKTFYMQSFIHELGHVTHYSLITTDPVRTAAAALFWRAEINAGTGRRYGTLAEYAPTETTGSLWADSIVEAIAECVKCTFYQGRLVYMNRTNWRIDESNWAALMDLLLGAGATGGFTQNFAGGIPPGYSIRSQDGQSGYTLVPESGLSCGSSSFSESHIAISNPAVALQESLSTVRVVYVRIPPFGGSLSEVFVGRGADGSDASSLAFGISDSSEIQVTLDFASSGPTVDLGLVWTGTGVSVGAGLYLAHRVTPTAAMSELWNADPHTAPPTAKLASTTALLSSPPTPQPGYLSIVNNGSDLFDNAVVVTDWTYESLASPTVPPYPFASAAGILVAGPGSDGQFRVAA